jgi:hypothetical protein
MAEYIHEVELTTREAVLLERLLNSHWAASKRLGMSDDLNMEEKDIEALIGKLIVVDW